MAWNATARGRTPKMYSVLPFRWSSFRSGCTTNPDRHCEFPPVGRAEPPWMKRPELSLRAKRSNLGPATRTSDRDCFVTPLLAMTGGSFLLATAKQSRAAERLIGPDCFVAQARLAMTASIWSKSALETARSFYAIAKRGPNADAGFFSLPAFSAEIKGSDWVLNMLERRLSCKFGSEKQGNRD